MTKVWHVLCDVGTEKWVPFAKQRATLLWDQLARKGANPGNRTWRLLDESRPVWIQIRIHVPNVWIRIWTEKCPTPMSGLVHVVDAFEPIVYDEDGVAALREFYPKVEPRAWRDEPKFGTNGAQSLTVRPTMYSGEMRKVVQTLMGVGHLVTYQYSWSTTHGVYTASNGGKWIVEIGTGGVFAWPMAVCRQMLNVPSLGYTPLPTPRPESPDELLSAEAMKEFYDNKSSFFTAMGWAFSESGVKACNIAHRIVDRWTYAELYTVTITEDSEFQPVSASLSLVEGGWVHGPKTTHMKYPNSDNRAIYSFDPYKGNATYVKECRAPVFCYYEGETLEVVRYMHNPHAAGNHVVDNWNDYSLAISKAGQIFEQKTYTVHSLPYFTSTRRQNNPVSTSWTGKERAYYVFEAPGLWVTQTAQAWGNEIQVSSIHCLSTVWREPASETNSHVDMLVVPLHEREGFYFITSKTSDRYIPTSENEVGGGSLRSYTFECEEACLATSSTACIKVRIGGHDSYWFYDANGEPRYAQFGSLTSKTYPTAGVGSLVQLHYQVWEGPSSSNNCDFFPNEIYTCPGSTSWYLIDEEITTYNGDFYGSGNFSAGLDTADPDFHDWFKFIDQWVYQAPQCVRDAYRPEIFALSELPRDVRGYQMKENYGDYPLDNVQFFFHFVGEP